LGGYRFEDFFYFKFYAPCLSILVLVLVLVLVLK